MPGDRLKPPRCKWCKARTEKLGKLLHDECIPDWLADHRKKQALKARKEQMAKAKVERAAFRKRKEAVKSRSKWEDECRKIVQKIARIRDRDDGCISCHLPASWDGQWHGSHFRSVGAASAVQFHLWNIHKACGSCNLHKSGNIAEYRPRIIEKIGQDRVDWLMAQNQIFKPPMDYYARFKRVMGKRLRRLEKSALQSTRKEEA
jgi:hypothetical protein